MHEPAAELARIRLRRGTPLFARPRTCYVTPAFRLRRNNSDNCNERQIAEMTITLLNGDIAAAADP